MASEGQVVLVTGGAGFLGQHIVKHLMEKAPAVKEVRVFDIQPYSNNLGHPEDKPLKVIIGDLRNESDLREAMRGVTTIIHAASIVDYRTFPNMERSKEINVEGTRRIIKLCQELNVEQLIYTSSVNVVIGPKKITDGTEHALPRLDRTIFPAYGNTKSEAEGLVNAASGKQLANGKTLRTIALRPVGMYGEGDPHYVTDFLRVASTAKNYVGALPTFTTGKMQMSYAGNVAWAHVVAMEKLSRDASVGGRGYFVTDDTPLEGHFDFSKPFLKSRNLDITKVKIPGMVVFLFVWLLECLLKVIRPIKEINFFVDSNSFLLACRTYSFSRQQAETLLGYKPIYSTKEAMQRSMSYYIKVDF